MPLQCAAESPSAIAMFLATPQNLARKPENTTAAGHEELSLPAVQRKMKNLAAMDPKRH